MKTVLDGSEVHGGRNAAHEEAAAGRIGNARAQGWAEVIVHPGATQRLALISFSAH